MSYPQPWMTTWSDAQPDSVQALFAAQFWPLPFAKRAEWQWGFNKEASLLENGERQRHFLLSLSAQADEDYTLALRALRHPGDSRLHLIILVKVRGKSEKEARQRALARWQELRANFPYDYHLQPLTSQQAFQEQTGHVWLSQADQPESIISLHRHATFLSIQNNHFYLLDQWQGAPRFDEQIWRALAACEGPLCYNVFLRPVHLYDAEWHALQEIEHGLRTVEIATNSWLTSIVNQAADQYRWRLDHFRTAYFVQIHLIAPGMVPPFLPHTLQAALTSGAATKPLYALTQQQAQPAPVNKQQGSTHLLRLDPVPGDRQRFDPRLQRLPYLSTLPELQTVFRLPFPPEKGLPGVVFAGMEEEKLLTAVDGEQ